MSGQSSKSSFRILKNAGLLSLARFSGDGLNFLLFIILSRQLGPGGIGEYAFGMAIALLVYSCVNFGLDDLAIRECAHLPSPERATLIAQLNGLQFLLILAVLAAFGGFMLIGHHSGSELQVVGILAVYYMALAVARILFTPAFAQQRMFGQAVAELCCRASVILAAIGLVWFWHAPLHIALLPYPAGGVALIAVAAGSAWRYNQQLRFKLSWRRVVETVKTAWPFGAAMLIFTLQMRINYVALGTILGREATGIYASAVKFLEAGVLPLTFLAMSTYPSLSRAHVKNPAALKQTSEPFVRVSLVGGALLAWFLVTVLPVIIVPVLGASFAPARQLFPAVGLLAVLISLDSPLDRVLLASKLQKVRLKFTLTGVLANLVLAIVLIPVFGIAGALAAAIVGQTIIIALTIKALANRDINPLTKRLGSHHLLALGAALAGGALADRLFHVEAWTAVAALTAMCAVWLATGFVSLKQFVGGSANAPSAAHSE